MKILLVIVTFIVLGLGAIFLTAEPAPSEDIASAGSAVSWQSIQGDISSGSKLLDVRTVQEYTDGHLEQSTLLPLSDIEKGTMPTQEKTSPIYVYCRSGNRSAQAKSLLEKGGFTNVTDLGAMTDVIAMGAKEQK